MDRKGTNTEGCGDQDWGMMLSKLMREKHPGDAVGGGEVDAVGAGGAGNDDDEEGSPGDGRGVPKGGDGGVDDEDAVDAVGSGGDAGTW